MQQLKSIQMLRAIAALMVVFFHYSIPLNLEDGSFFATLLSHGWAGVDIFFIISGFIAAYTVRINDSGFKSGANYIIKRLCRIVPLYYLITLFSIGHSQETFIESIKSIFFIPIGGIGDDSLGPMYGGARVSQGWTLNYEVFFYIVVALSFALGKFKWFFVSAFMISVIIIPLLIYPIPPEYGYQGYKFQFPYLSMMTNPIIFEFLLGVGVYFIYQHMNSRLNFTWIIFITASIALFCYNLYSPVLPLSRITHWGLPSAFLIVSLLKIEKSNRLPNFGYLLTLGNLSFSIYLLHDGVQKITRRLVKGLTSQDFLDTIEARLFVFSLSIALTIALSMLTYKYIEQTGNRKFRKLALIK